MLPLAAHLRSHRRWVAVGLTASVAACTPLKAETTETDAGSGYPDAGPSCAGEACPRPFLVQAVGTPATKFVVDDRHLVYSLGVARWGDRIGAALGSCGDRTAPVGPVEGLGPVVSISGGDQFAVALDGDGRVLAWGRNAAGELGRSGPDQCAPQLVEGLPRIAAVAAGYHHVLAIDTDGAVWAWGDNGAGQLGTGDRGSVSGPVRVPGLPFISQVAAGRGHSLALATDGRLFSWGGSATDRFEFGELGRPRTAPETPGLVEGLTDATTQVVSLAAGGGVSFALRDDGEVFGWGGNYEGELCLGRAGEVSHATPTRIPALRGAQTVTCGHAHCVALGADGAVLAWGDDAHGQLGNGETAEAVPTAQRPALPGEVRSIGAGGWTSLAVDSDGRLWSWGVGEDGVSGRLDADDRLRPELVELPPRGP